MFNREELLAFHKDMTGRALELMKKKNHDYAGEGGQNPFANFTRCEALGICSTEQGMLVRLSDKLSRLATFAAAGRLLVADEGVTDTCDDMVNYAVLFAAWCAGKKRDGQPLSFTKGERIDFKDLAVGADFILVDIDNPNVMRKISPVQSDHSGRLTALCLRTNVLKTIGDLTPVHLVSGLPAQTPYTVP